MCPYLLLTAHRPLLTILFDAHEYDGYHAVAPPVRFASWVVCV
jgi:hypothetical protein